MVKAKENKTKLTILVTGGAGFLGKAIIDELSDASCLLNPAEIRILDINKYEGNGDKRIRSVKGNICNYSDITKACREIDLVIHTAAIVDWGTKSEKEVYRVNYTGTVNVVNACKENNVQWLVYTSSLDTVISGKPLVDIDENIAYPKKHPNMYCKSKYLAEKLVMEENNTAL
ncbi:MAG: NAD-dependent epimerase/dehydratase family protein, partial [Bacteroidales bacterium]